MAIQAPQDHYVRVGSLNIRFWAAGDAGSPVLLIHGLGSSMEDWLNNIDVLAEHHRVHALDLPGNGYSDKPVAHYTAPYFSQTVRDFLQSQGIAKAAVIGHSLGGLVALDFAIRYPDLVEKLIVIAPAGLSKEVASVFRLCALPWVGERLTRPSLKGTARMQSFYYYNQALVTPELVEFKYKLAMQPGMQAAMLATMRENGNLFGGKDAVVRSIAGNLGRITAPTLVIWGRHDRAIPVAQAEVARQGIRDVRVHILEECGHAVEMECAETFNNLVLEFLGSPAGEPERGQVEVLAGV